MMIFQSTTFPATEIFLSTICVPAEVVLAHREFFQVRNLDRINDLEHSTIFNLVSVNKTIL